MFPEMLVAHMREGASFESFAAEVGVSMDSLYEWSKKYPAFSEAKKIGKMLELKWWETVSRGGVTGKIAGYNAATAIFSMKNKFPKLYRDTIKVDAEITIDTAAEKMRATLTDPKLREAALMLAESLAEQHSQDTNGNSED